jgi:transposase-like protein
MHMVLQGVSTRRVKKITTELCGREFGKWAVPRLSKDLDEQVEAWSSRSLEEKNASAALEVLEDGHLDPTAVLGLPGKYRHRLRTTNMLERFIEEIRRREKGIRIFPNLDSAERLVAGPKNGVWTGHPYIPMCCKGGQKR